MASFRETQQSLIQRTLPNSWGVPMSTHEPGFWKPWIIERRKRYKAYRLWNTLAQDTCVTNLVNLGHAFCWYNQETGGTHYHWLGDL